MLKKWILVLGILILGVTLVTGVKVYATSFDTTEAVGEEAETTEKTNNGVRLNCSSVSHWTFCHWLWYCGCGCCFQRGWCD